MITREFLFTNTLICIFIYAKLCCEIRTIKYNYQVIYSASGYNESAILNAIDLALSYVPRDQDGDGVMDNNDNCIATSNYHQDDYDLDGSGDACDPCNNLDIYVIGDISKW